MADKLSPKEMREFIPTVTSYRYNIARRHRLIYGRAAPLPNQEKRRMRIEPVKLEHFVSFITSPRVIQDVPFGEKLHTQCYQNNDTRAHRPAVSTILL